MKYNIYDKDNIENAIKYYYKNKVSHKEAYEKFNIKRATYFTYLKIYKESDFSQTGGNKKYEDFQKTNNVFKKKEEAKSKDILEVMNNLGGRCGGRKNAHSGFTDIMEKQEKKNNNESNVKKEPKRVSGILNQGLDIEIGKYSKQ